MDESVYLPCLPLQVATARRFVTGLLAGCPRLDDAVLIVSELAGNTVRHSPARGGGRFHVRLSATRGGTRIAVTTAGAGLWVPAPRVPAEVSADAAEAGRGLAVVYALADRVGHDWDGALDSVWVELDCLCARPAPARAPVGCPEGV